MNTLTLKQQEFMTFHRQWFKQIPIRLKRGQPLEPYYIL